MENSKIEWTHHTRNIWIGCDEVHAGCDNCYARIFDNRWNKKNWGKQVSRRFVKKNWSDFNKFNSAAAATGEQHRVFVGSMMDIAEKSMPMEDFSGNPMTITTGELRKKYFDEIIPATPSLVHLLLSKRPGNYKKHIPENWLKSPPKNVIFGASISDQPSANTLIPLLLTVPGKRFLSIEPMLGPIDLEILYGRMDHILDGIDWIIVGGESGAKKRPFEADWARAIMEICKRMGKPFFMKQMDKIKPIPSDLLVREFPNLDY